MSAFALTGVCKTFAGRGGLPVTALDEVTIQAGRGEVVAVIGESGAGKSSLARVVPDWSRPTGAGSRSWARSWSRCRSPSAVTCDAGSRPCSRNRTTPWTRG
jgi:ABC-type glutathione transport system ATPase component